jgi:hypothetical protein
MVTSQNLEDLRGNGHGYIVGRNRRRSGEVFDYIQSATGPWIECPVGITAREKATPPKTLVQEVVAQEPGVRVFVVHSEERLAYERAQRIKAMDRVRTRLEKLQRDPLTRWRVTKDQWRNWRLYDRFIEAAEAAIRRTSVASAPWLIVEGGEERYRTLTVADALLAAIERRLDGSRANGRPRPVRQRGTHAANGTSVANVRPQAAAQPTILSHLDMSLAVAR